MSTAYGPNVEDTTQDNDTQAEYVGQAPNGEQGSQVAGGQYGGSAPYGWQAPYGWWPRYGQAAYGQPGYGQAAYGAPAGYGGTLPPPPPPAWPGPGDGKTRRRRRGLAIAAGVAAVAIAAGGTAWATSSSAAPASTLTAAQIASKTDPALVDVMTTLDYGQGSAAGTGMVLTSNGEVLTNNHVVAGATSIKVRDVGNGRTYSATVVGYDDTGDVAVIKLTDASGLKTITTGDSSKVAVGQRIVALGNAGGTGGTPHMVTGTVTGLGASITATDEGSGNSEHLTDMIRTNADIQPGDSGGSLVNSSGQVIGMDTAASTASPGIGTTASETTAAFAIPINRALSIAHQIEAGKASSTVHIGATAFLGVEIDSSSSGGYGYGGYGYGGYGGYGEPQTGVVIAGTVSGTAAAQAGLTQGDSIVSVDGHDVTSSSDLQSLIETHHPGDKVTIEWQDPYGQSHTATVTLTAGPVG